MGDVDGLGLNVIRRSDPQSLATSQMSRTLTLSVLSLAASIGTIGLAVAFPAGEHNRTAGAIGILFGGLIAPAALVITAARD